MVKDYAAKPFFFRSLIGITSNRREAFIYRKLKGLPGIPEWAGWIDRYAIAVHYVPSRNASELKSGELTPAFFKRLREIVDAIHERGVVLCDLRNIKNIMLGEDGEPYLIDFSTAFRRGAPWNVPKNFLYNLFYQDDLLGIAKLKKHCAPNLLTEEERIALEKGLFLQREALFIKHKGRALLQRIFGFGRSHGKSQKGDSQRLQ